MQRRGIGGQEAAGASGAIPIRPSHKELLERRPAFMKREEMLSILRQGGYAFSGFLIGQMKIPNNVLRGEGEMEFFGTDIKSRPENPSGEQDPIHCLNNRLPPPPWLGRWYMAIIPEDGRKSIVFFYRPKGVFAKFPIEKADTDLPEAMRSHTVSRKCDWAGAKR